jgi:hypothetical protein
VKPKQRGNIAPADGTDPFPKAGLTKQYGRVIRFKRQKSKVPNLPFSGL